MVLLHPEILSCECSVRVRRSFYSSKSLQNVKTLGWSQDNDSLIFFLADAHARHKSASFVVVICCGSTAFIYRKLLVRAIAQGGIFAVWKT